jgi:hypothetical protein
MKNGWAFLVDIKQVDVDFVKTHLFTEQIASAPSLLQLQHVTHHWVMLCLVVLLLQLLMTPQQLSVMTE